MLKTIVRNFVYFILVKIFKIIYLQKIIVSPIHDYRFRKSKLIDLDIDLHLSIIFEKTNTLSMNYR